MNYFGCSKQCLEHVITWVVLSNPSLAVFVAGRWGGQVGGEQEVAADGGQDEDQDQGEGPGDWEAAEESRTDQGSTRKVSPRFYYTMLYTEQYHTFTY